MSKFTLRAVAAAVALTAGASQATVINLIDLGGVTGSQAEQGFKIAAGYWAGMFTNDATINLGVRFAALPPNVIGSTGSRQADFSVAEWESRVNATKSNSVIDQTAVLPGLTNGGVSGLTVGVDADGNNDSNVTAAVDGKYASQVLYTNTALIKAVGGAVSNPDTRLDGNVTFSSTFGFDFNPMNGITANTFDFIGVAIHEIGHALGFVSGIDLVDYFSYGNGPGAGALGYDLNDTSIFSALDMFRYSAPGTLDFRTGGTKYFSIDGGQTALFGNTMSTGSFNGDGNQTSHWKDTPRCAIGNGIMDPTFCFGQMGYVTGLDLAAFDAMGWNLSANALTYANTSTSDILRAAVPEPSSLALFLAAGVGLVASRRKAKQRSAKA